MEVLSVLPAQLTQPQCVDVLPQRHGGLCVCACVRVHVRVCVRVCVFVCVYMYICV